MSDDKNANLDSSLFGDSDIFDKYFDAAYYISQDETLQNKSYNELVEHYMEVGSDLGFDPNPWFCTSFYNDNNEDVASDRINPFLHFLKHGEEEERKTIPDLPAMPIHDLQALDTKTLEKLKQKYKKLILPKVSKSEFQSFLNKCLEDHQENDSVSCPEVSVIVPNYNHEKFLAERIESILRQSEQSIEIIILDDCSSDNSVEIIETYANNYPNKIKFIKNSKNSGNVFKQWRKGIEACTGRYLWICESDDTAETDFLERTIPAFTDPAVMIAFCKVQFIDDKGNELEGLDAYRNRAESNVWSSDRSGPAAAWFSGAFSVHNIIPNVGGCLIKRQKIEDSVWQKAEKYNILGDWFLYLNLSRGGKIAYVESATTYFRQHDKNTSVASFKGNGYYKEHNELALAVKKHWAVTPDTTWRFYKQIQQQFTSTFDDGDLSLFDYVSLDQILSQSRQKEHILIGFLGFHVGGGEYFPIYIANALVELGLTVSMLAIDLSSINEDMHQMLDSRIPVYSAQDVRQLGVDEFISQTGTTIINSHHIGVEGLFFLELHAELEIPYVSTLHGTYEVATVSEYYITKIVRSVDHWIYTATKNVKHVENRSWCKTKKTMLPNATPIESERHHLTRDLLNISSATFVYILISRPVKEKGWEDAILAFKKLKQTEDVALLLVGDGEYQKELESKYIEEEGIFFLGYQTNMHGLLSICDCCLLPTRFPGESYPLILIQAMQVGLPCVSTDIAEISSMLSLDGQKAGIVLDHKDDENFVTNLETAAVPA